MKFIFAIATGIIFTLVVLTKEYSYLTVGIVAFFATLDEIILQLK